MIAEISRAQRSDGIAINARNAISGKKKGDVKSSTYLRSLITAKLFERKVCAWEAEPALRERSFTSADRSRGSDSFTHT